MDFDTQLRIHLIMEKCKRIHFVFFRRVQQTQVQFPALRGANAGQFLFDDVQRGVNLVMKLQFQFRFAARDELGWILKGNLPFPKKHNLTWTGNVLIPTSFPITAMQTAIVIYRKFHRLGKFAPHAMGTRKGRERTRFPRWTYIILTVACPASMNGHIE